MDSHEWLGCDLLELVPESFNLEKPAAGRRASAVRLAHFLSIASRRSSADRL